MDLRRSGRKYFRDDREGASQWDAIFWGSYPEAPGMAARRLREIAEQQPAEVCHPVACGSHPWTNRGGGEAGSFLWLSPVGPQAGRINNLWWILFWVSMAVFTA